MSPSYKQTAVTLHTHSGVALKKNNKENYLNRKTFSSELCHVLPVERERAQEHMYKLMGSGHWPSQLVIT